MFTDAGACAVGPTESKAREQGHAVRVVEYDIGSVTGAYLQGENYQGRAKAAVDESRRVLLGVTFVGPGRRGAAAFGDRRGHRGGTAGPALARRTDLPTVREVWLRLLETYGL